MKKLLVFDMDGTIVDLYSVENWLEKLRNEDASPYIDASPIFNMAQLVTILKRLQLEGWKIAITSWLAMNSTLEYKNAVREAKREWLSSFNFPFDEIHLVQYGTPKQKCTKADLQILIDDSEAVRKSFEDEERRQYTVNPLETDLLQYLENLI